MPMCLCEAVRPLTVLCQCLGLLPMKFDHEACWKSCHADGIAFTVSSKTSNDKGSGTATGSFASTCAHRCHFRQISWPSLFNFTWSVNFIAIAVRVHIQTPAILQRHYHGIDLYVLYAQIFTTYYKLLLILLLARWKATEMALTWDKIREIFVAVKNNYRNPPSKDIMFQTWALLAFIVIPSVWYMYTNNFGIIEDCLVSKEHGERECSISPAKSWAKLMQCLPSVFFGAFAVYFLSLCTMLRLLNREISNWLKQQLNMASTKSIDIQTIRLAQADLSRAVSMVSDCFGMHALVIIATVILSLTLNFYKIMVTPPSTQGQSNGLYCLWVFYIYFGLFALACLLLGGQFVKNLGNLPHQVIHEAAYKGHDEASRFEILLLLDQVKNMPEITAGGIADIKMSFLSSAVTTIATYLLVLLQFRLAN